jgi:hypothetical protein
MVIIGLAGKMGAGKNYIAEHIIAPYIHSLHETYLIVAFGDHLKLDVLNKYRDEPDITFDSVVNTKPLRVRQLLQYEGTELARAANPLVWINYLDNWIKLHHSRGVTHFIITDIRFKNEADWIRSHPFGGHVIHLDYLERTPMYTDDIPLSISTHPDHHISEHDLDDYPHYDAHFTAKSHTTADTAELTTIIMQYLHTIHFTI